MDTQSAQASHAQELCTSHFSQLERAKGTLEKMGRATSSKGSRKNSFMDLWTQSFAWQVTLERPCDPRRDIWPLLHELRQPIPQWNVTDGILATQLCWKPQISLSLGLLS